jgi:divalent metal cation (Fe/Co/Zn/Cd) transporter
MDKLIYTAEEQKQRFGEHNGRMRKRQARKKIYDTVADAIFMVSVAVSIIGCIVFIAAFFAAFELLQPIGTIIITVMLICWAVHSLFEILSYE